MTQNLSLFEKYTITSTLLSFVGLLLTITIDPFSGGYLMLTGLGMFTIQILYWEFKNAKI